MTLRHAMLIALTAVALGACETPRPHAEGLRSPATLYVNGSIVTMEGASPDYVDAMVVNDGRITFVGSRAQARKIAGLDATEIDLEGHTLLPGFVDADSGSWNTNAEVDAALASVDRYARVGYTTARVGRASRADTEMWRQLAGQSRIKIDLAIYPEIPSELTYMKLTFTTRAYSRHFRVAGVRLNLDAVSSAAEREALISTAFENHWQVLTECHGGQAAGALMDAVARAGSAYGNNDRRTVLIPTEIDPEDGLDRMKTLGVIQSYRIPTAPLAGAMTFVHAAVNRRIGRVDDVSPDEHVSPYVALKSITEWAAYQYFEESSKGTLAPGKLADFVILDRDPLNAPPDTIKDIQVLETIKEGVPVFKK